MVAGAKPLLSECYCWCWPAPDTISMRRGSLRKRARRHRWPSTRAFTPLNVDNPALRMDILKRFLALEYKGVHRSIFSATLAAASRAAAHQAGSGRASAASGAAAADGGREIFRICQR